MKKICLLVILCLLLLSYAISEKHYKEFINNQFIGKWVEEIITSYDYDENGNEIHLKTSDDYESWSTFDSENRKLSTRNSDGYAWAYMYDENGNLITEFTPHGEFTYFYDSHGKKIREKSISGYEKWYEYDATGHVIYAKDSYNQKEYWNYNSNGQKIYSKTDSDLLGIMEQWYAYDRSGNCITIKWQRADFWGQENYEYDAKKNRIHWKDIVGNEEWYVYSYDENGRIKQKITYKYEP